MRYKYFIIEWAWLNVIYLSLNWGSLITIVPSQPQSKVMFIKLDKKLLFLKRVTRNSVFFIVKMEMGGIFCDRSNMGRFVTVRKERHSYVNLSNYHWHPSLLGYLDLSSDMQLIYQQMGPTNVVGVGNKHWSICESGSGRCRPLACCKCETFLRGRL